MKQRMERVKSQYTINSDLWERWQEWLAKDSLWPPFVGVKHGDLHPGHILIDENQCVTGVIDWSEGGGLVMYLQTFCLINFSLGKKD